MATPAVFEVEWREGPLGLRFTPNERDEPVVCQVPVGANAAVLASPAAVGDVLEAFRLSPSTPFQRLASFDELLSVLARAALPVTLRFRSRERDAPASLDAQAPRYSFTWKEKAPLGVSLAMDPCSLHAAITSVDAAKISLEFKALGPAPGDLLARIEAGDKRVELDSMRFEEVIDTLRAFPRPCKLTFARVQEECGASPPVRRPTVTKQSQQEAQRPRLRLMPIAQRQSFKIDAPRAKSQAPTDDSPFYTVVYAGGAVGLHLRDCTQDDRRHSAQDRSNRTNGYSVAVKDVTDARSAPGLEHASEGDLLMAIGQKDLQHLGFDQVRAELGRIREPTQLLFKKRKRVTSGSSGTASTLVDSLLLFLV